MEQVMTLLLGTFDFVTKLTTWRMRDERGNVWLATGSLFLFDGIKRVPAVYRVNDGEVGAELIEPERIDVPRDGVRAPDAVWRREAN